MLFEEIITAHCENLVEHKIRRAQSFNMLQWAVLRFEALKTEEYKDYEIIKYEIKSNKISGKYMLYQ
jgi:hypothetical protein